MSSIAFINSLIAAIPLLDVLTRTTDSSVDDWLLSLARQLEGNDDLINELDATHGQQAEIYRAESAADAVGEADIICATTTSSTPVFEDIDIKPGAHINAVGSYTAGAREVSGATVARAWLLVDDRGAAWAEAGDLIQARDEGLIGADHIRADLGELVIDRDLRPKNPRQITLFKSVGVAVQDAFAASAALEGANQRGLGSVVAW
jgi:ornithine cyclodeaminase/alanine dehydrogenase-like protein (mu-crystallin family)